MKDLIKSIEEEAMPEANKGFVDAKLAEAMAALKKAQGASVDRVMVLRKIAVVVQALSAAVGWASTKDGTRVLEKEVQALQKASEAIANKSRKMK